MEATKRDRQGKLKGAIFEVKSIVDDFRMQAISGMMAARELWERAMVPSLLSGAGTWLGASTTEIEMCDKIQDIFWRVMFEVPESCPRIALRAETRMVGIEAQNLGAEVTVDKKNKKSRPFNINQKNIHRAKEQ